MNREDIIRMARGAGFAVGLGSPVHHKLNAFAALVAAAERNILAAWMIQFGFATGHGDTMEQLVDALGSEIVDRIEIEIDVAVAAERKVIMDSLQKQADLATDALDRRRALEMKAAVSARGKQK